MTHTAHTKPTLLMCPPLYFTILPKDPKYGWLNEQSRVGWAIYQKDPNGFQKKALEQWHAYRASLEKLATIIELDPDSKLHDLTFTADPSLSFEDSHHAFTFLSHFAHPKRQEEVERHKALIQKNYPKRSYLTLQAPCEGSGDNLFDPYRGVFWSGYSTQQNTPAAGRSSQRAHRILEQHTQRRVLSLEVQRPFFHLDTTFMPLSQGHILVYPKGLTQKAYETIIKEGLEAFELDPKTYLIEVNDNEANDYACNLVQIETTLFLQKQSTDLCDRLSKLGYEVVDVDVSQFMLAGGGPHCLVNMIDGFSKERLK